MPKLLVIGSGYLGKAVAEVFRAAGWEVDAVSLSGGDGSIAADVSDAGSVRALAARARPDFIIHCAASGRGGSEAYQRVYVDGCRNLVAAFPGVRILFTSSTSVYAQTDGSEVNEESAAEPDRETGKLLLKAERIVLDGGGVVARLSGIYGPGRSVILKKFLDGEAVIEEDGRRFLNQIHRDDAAKALLVLAETEAAGVFIVSDFSPLSQIECYQMLSERFGKPLPPTGPRDPNRKRGWTHKRVSSAKLAGLGWKPAFPAFADAVDSVATTL